MQGRACTRLCGNQSGGEQLLALANFSKSSRKTVTVPFTVYALLEMHKKPFISSIRKICHVQFIKISVTS